MSFSFSNVAGIGTVASVAGAMANTSSGPAKALDRLDMPMGQARRQHNRERTQGSGLLGRRVGMANRAMAPGRSEKGLEGLLSRAPGGMVSGGIGNIVSKLV